MPAVTDTVRRHPATTAHFIATLDHLSRGRAILGIGAGELFNFEPLPDVLWKRPVTRLREAIRLIKALWSATKEQPASFQGSIFGARRAWLGLAPLQKPHPPIYVGGYGPRMKELIAQEADGWLPWLETPETYKRASAVLDTEASSVGRDPAQIERAIEIFTAITQDSKKVDFLVKRASIGVAIRQDLLRQLGLEGLAREAIDVVRATFRDGQMEKINSIAERIPPEIVRELIVSGTPDQAIEHIERFRKAGARTIVLISPSDLLTDNLRAYRNHIIPHYRSTAA
jgi:alkanesulfonate monooxygenase SsuD/methylene tetrahydromethanopterin reductase-like flavin-dependent oxidoreductase (luciferase family)